VGSYGVETPQVLPHEPEMGPPETKDSGVTQRGIRSGAVEFEGSLDDNSEGRASRQPGLETPAGARDRERNLRARTRR